MPRKNRKENKEDPVTHFYRDLSDGLEEFMGYCPLYTSEGAYGSENCSKACSHLLEVLNEHNDITGIRGDPASDNHGYLEQIVKNCGNRHCGSAVVEVNDLSNKVKRLYNPENEK